MIVVNMLEHARVLNMKISERLLCFQMMESLFTVTRKYLGTPIFKCDQSHAQFDLHVCTCDHTYQMIRTAIYDCFLLQYASKDLNGRRHWQLLTSLNVLR